jgi:type IV pilus assembly protein PilV
MGTSVCRAARRAPVQHIQRGFSLLEVLVAVLVLSIGLLGLAGLYAVGLRSVDSANLRTQATILAEDMLERMRANREAATAGAYDIANLEQDPSGDTAAATDVAEWKWRLGLVFQQPDGSIACDGNGVCVVTLSFDDTRGLLGVPTEVEEGEDPTPATPSAFTFSTRL